MSRLPMPEGLPPEVARVWQRVLRARDPERPYTLDYLQILCEDFLEFHGDRRFGDDPAIVAGLARFRGRSVVVIGHQKGRDLKENVRRNFGMPHPEGYRKALRLFRYAERFGFPVLTFIDTPGASPDMAAEERGQAEAIAENLWAMLELRAPIVAAVIGEGGSGGALALSVADRILMLENAIYSVASPEASASILWRDAARAPYAAAAMRITAEDLAALGIVDEVIPEPPEGAHTDPEGAARRLGEALERHLADLEARYRGDGGWDWARLLADRRRKYRRIGVFYEAGRRRVHGELVEGTDRS